MKELWVAEYSIQQKCVHVGAMNDMLECNIKKVLRGIDNGYVPLFVSESREEASKFASIVQAWRDRNEKNAQEPI